jgi:hypothetical protein
MADWQALLAEGGLHEEGWATVEFLTSEEAATVTSLRFAPAYAPAPSALAT